MSHSDSRFVADPHQTSPRNGTTPSMGMSKPWLWPVVGGDVV
jgi:hypothetical protein